MWKMYCQISSSTFHWCAEKVGLDDGDDSILSLFVLFTRVVISLSKHWLHPQPVWQPHYHLSNGF